MASGGWGLSHQHVVTASSRRRGAVISPSLSHPISNHPPGQCEQLSLGSSCPKKNLPCHHKPRVPHTLQCFMAMLSLRMSLGPWATGVHEERCPTIGPGGSIWAAVQPFMGKSPPPLCIPGEKRVMFGAVSPERCRDGSFLSHLSS